MTDALMRSRDGTVKQAFAPLNAPVYQQKEVGLTDSMHRWESLLRFNVALFDLLSQLKFESSTGAPGNVQKGKAELLFNGGLLLSMERPDLAFFRDQFELVRSYAEIRPDRASEIVAQLQPQTPFWSGAVHLNPAHTPKTLELVELALGFASILCMRFKQAMAVPRPIDWSVDIQPIVPTPSHSAYPSGHATEAYMIAYTLPSLITSDATVKAAYEEQLLDQAYRIAVNRTVAGVHFPVDSLAGQALAKAASDYFLWQCGKQINACTQSVNPANGTEDFGPTSFVPGNNAVAAIAGRLTEGKHPLVWIANRAAKEWE